MLGSPSQPSTDVDGMHLLLARSQRILNKPTCYRPVPLQKAKRLCKPAEDWGKLREKPDEAAPTIPPPDTEAAAVEPNEEGSVNKEATAAVSDEVVPSHASLNQDSATTNEVTVGTVELEEKEELPQVVE